MSESITLRLNEGSAGDVYSALQQALWDNSMEMVLRKHEPKKESRSEKQNRLSFKWYGEIDAQTKNGINFERARCKLMYGVPILRAESEKFREVYDRYLKDYSYEAKLEIIEVMEIPVTRLMTTKQMSIYLNTVDMETASKLGFPLTHPEDLYYDSLGVKK